jgi:hypothetical protein
MQNRGRASGRLLIEGLLLSLLLVFLTFIIRNEALVPFTKGHPDVFPQQYGLPFAFRETWVFVDTHGSHFHWRFFLLDAAVIFPFVAFLLHWLAYAQKFQKT